MGPPGREPFIRRMERAALRDLEVAFRHQDADGTGLLTYDQFFAMFQECDAHAERLAPDLDAIARDMEEQDKREKEELSKPFRKKKTGWDALYDL